ncbi:hypothetical protein POM88_009749 [Heracleum sosnowskyi]|uniref:Uncharacterized protein n=1 Tax=Heracleum sosnowskyi TaxID=360622 RepID=A0AAD8N8Q0_9APIA|nr:hypothetical protein POM88_009749 [Heracleum sosnowskyi]
MIGLLIDVQIALLMFAQRMSKGLDDSQLASHDVHVELCINIYFCYSLQTELCGWGVEAAEPMNKGDFIIEYVGEGHMLIKHLKLSRPSRGEKKEVLEHDVSKPRYVRVNTLKFNTKVAAAVFRKHHKVVTETWGLSRQNVQDFSLYTGTLGTAYLLFKSYQVSNNKSDLDLSFQIVKACDSASSHSE